MHIVRDRCYPKAALEEPESYEHFSIFANNTGNREDNETNVPMLQTW